MKKFFSLIALFACAISGWAQAPTDVDLGKYITDELAKAGSGAGVSIELAAGATYTMNEVAVIPDGVRFWLSGSTSGAAPVVKMGADATFQVGYYFVFRNVDVDASAMTKPFITINGSTTPAVNADGTVNANYKSITGVAINNSNISGLKKAIVRDEQKCFVQTISIYESNIEVEGSSVLFDFNGKGFARQTVVDGSTIWSKAGHTGYFIQTSGRVKDLDGDQNTYKQVVNINNSTLYKISQGKQLNNLQGKGQKSLSFGIYSSILYDCTQDGNEVRGWLGGQNSTNPSVTYGNNTYWNNGQEQVGWTDSSKQGYDASENSVVDDPLFKDAANGDFTVNKYALQSKFKVGDPRWLVSEYDDAFEKIEEDFEEFKDMRQTFTDALGTTLDQLVEIYPEVAAALTALDKSLESLPAEIQAAKKNEDPSIANKVNALEDAFAALTGALEATPYGDVVKGLYGLSLKYIGIMEEYGDQLGDLRLTELSSRVKDGINREFLILAQDLQLHPTDPSNLRLNFHRTRVLLIAASIRALEEAIDQHLSLEGRLKSIVEAIGNIIRGKVDLYNAHSAVIVADDELQTEWNSLCSRIEAENAAINALDAETASAEEISAHEVELSNITNELEAFAAKLAEGEATAIESATAAKNANGVIFNMAGQKVDANYRGIVIKNGKKVMVK